MKLAIINGPNLNLLGKREPSIYGNTDFKQFLSALQKAYPQIDFAYRQSNVEGKIVDALHEFGFSYDGIIINAGAYTHTSIAIRDAIAGVETQVIEVHISNTLSREEFRHSSVIGAVCKGCIMGFGLDSYRLAVEYFMSKNTSDLQLLK